MPEGPARRALAALVLGLAATAHAAEAPFSFATTPGVLPKDVVPVEYALHLRPDLGARTFRGTQTVTFDVHRPTRSIVMNALDLHVAAATLRGPRGPRERRVVLAPPRSDVATQTIAFALPAPLAPGRYTLAMAWRGTLNGAVEGLYLDRQVDAGGEHLTLATDLEPTSARRVLPCWDEPAFRARFRLSVDVVAGASAYSNMPVARSAALPGGGRRVAFAATPPMPTYLLALVAGDLERVEAIVDGTRVGVVAGRGKRDRTAYPLAASAALLRYFNDYFAVPYPLPKLDQIAITGGFFGGMENWGAIVYNESVLLIDPATATAATRLRVHGLIAHEMAHQWFGNLVTMAWWDNLWLNEAFAEWMAIKASAEAHPQAHLWLRAKAASENAMELDARATTHPIQQPVTSDSEAQSAFDTITYDKGSGFLRMLEAYLGEAPFRDGIRAYLKRHRYANTTGADLWTALAAASGKPVAAIAADWTTQPGFPLLDVDAQCESGRRRVVLRQQPFRVPDDGAGAGERRWSVPVQLGSVGAGAGATDYLLLRESSAAVVRADDCAAPLVVDADSVGFFRVRYAPPLFDALATRWPVLPDGARLKLLADTSALVRADQAPLAQWLALVERIGDEPRLAVWDQLLADLERFDRLSVGEAARPALHRFAVGVVAPTFERLGWDERADEPVEARQLRARLAATLSRYGDATTIAEGQRRFARWVAEPTSLAPSLVNAVVEIAGRHADVATYETLLALARRAPTSEERFRAYRAIAAARDPALAARTVELAGDRDVPQIIRHELLASVARWDHGELAWAYAREHAQALLADRKLHDGGRTFAAIVSASASAATADELESFAQARLPADALAEVRRGEDEIRTRAALKARLWPELAATLAAR
ncbi:MAG: M1 family metallopeptidase [Caldimonas sp.]